jgi:anthranilate synthase component 2
MRILLIDNYDSFTYNLLHLLEMNESVTVDVFRNDATLPDITKYDAIVLSPGPGLPSEAGQMPGIILKYAPTKPILGICLGMQGIAEAYGGKLKNLDKVLHGVSKTVHVVDNNEILFENVPSSFAGGRYHSWVVDGNNLPSCLIVTAEDEDGNIMALRHIEYPLCGVQFHPESVLTQFGQDILRNWVEKERAKR